MIPKVSVIIPVYNIEEYLEECILSVLRQTLTEIEIIIINDGSTDQSQSIIEKYERNDDRIVAVYQKNQGVSIARNHGIHLAKGNYIGFVDSDDTIAEDFFESLYNATILESADIIISKTILGRDSKYIIKKSVFPPATYYKSFITNEIISNLLESEDLFAIWNKIYKREFIKNKISFPENIRREEDAIFNLSAFLEASRVTFIDYSGYFYRERNNSVSRLLINNDVFKVALDKYHFNYVEYFGLKIPLKEIYRLKTNRLLKKTCFIIFQFASHRGYNFRKPLNEIIINTTIQDILNNKDYKLTNSSIFEKIVLFCIMKKRKNTLTIFLKLIQTIYHPKFSELFRKLNFKS